MAKLTSKQRNAEPKSDFGLPGVRKYPMPDRTHAAVAKSYASKERNAGRLSPSQYHEVMDKANAKLKRGK